jgi:translation elongation factor EF-1alpha
MSSNAKIVLFGPAHSGKSTLAGYLRYQSEPAEAESEIKKVRAELRDDFDEAQALAYLVDISNDERHRKKESTQGQSKRLHISKFRIMDRPGASFYTLDTPGAEHSTSQRYRGILFSDAGVYCVEAAKILRIMETAYPETNLSSVLSYVLSWSIIRPQAPLAIVLTKMDEVDWSKNCLSKAKQFAITARRMFNVDFVVPISIDVRARIGKNIRERHDHCEWSLLEAMSSLATKLAQVPQSLQSSDPFLFVAGQVGVEGGIGTRLLGKVIAGNVRSRDQVAVYQRSRATPVHARVRKLVESPDYEVVEELEAGDLGGISLSKQVEHVPGTLICDERLDVRCGTILRIEVAKLLKSSAIRLIGRQISVLHLGSRFEARVADLKLDDDELQYDSRSETSLAKAVITIIIRSGIIWVPTEQPGAQKSNLRSALISLTGHGENELVSGVILECGLRAKVDFRDDGLELLVRDATQRSPVPKFDTLLRETDNDGIDYLLTVWRSHRMLSQSSIGPLRIAVLS